MKSRFLGYIIRFYAPYPASDVGKGNCTAAGLVTGADLVLLHFNVDRNWQMWETSSRKSHQQINKIFWFQVWQEHF